MSAAGPVEQDQRFCGELLQADRPARGQRVPLVKQKHGFQARQDALREVQLARTLAARHAMQIASDGVQIFGGHGFVKEYPVERWYRDLRATALMEGAVLL